MRCRILKFILKRITGLEIEEVILEKENKNK